MRIVLQQSEQDCLLACYSMVLSSMGSRVSPGELRDWKPLPPDGLSVGFLRLLNSEYGLTMSARKVDRNQVSDDSLRRLTTPVIAHWEGHHFVVIEKFGRRRVSVIDPALGRLRITYQDFWVMFTDALVFLKPSDDFKRHHSASSLHQPLRALFPASAGALLTLSIILAQLVTLGVTAGTRQLVHLGPPAPILVLGSLALTATLTAASFTIRSLGLQRGSNHFESTYTKRLFSGVFAQRLSYFTTQSVGAITEKIGLRFILKNALVMTILPSVLSVLSLLLTLTYLVLVSPPLASLLVAGSTLYFLVSLFLTRRQMEASQTQVQAQVQMSGETQATLTNIDAVKATGTEEHHLRRWISMNQRVNMEYNRVIRWSTLTAGVQTGYTTSMLVLIVATGLWLVGSGQASIADIILFQTGMALFTGAVSEAQGVVQQIANVAVYQDKQADLFHASPCFGELIPADEPGRIEARSLAFGYPGSALVCNGIDLQAAPGEKIAVFGPSGAGKSTLLCVLLGLNDFSGTLKVGDAHFRETTGVVFPKMTLVEGTIRENLMLGYDHDVNDADLLDILADVNLDQTVNRLPAKLDSRVQAGGRNFSTGQAQRLLLARALVRGRQFLFLDEAVSSLDEDNRRHIYKHVIRGERYRDVTMVMVSHDPTVMEYCETVWSMADRDSFDVMPTSGRFMSATVTAPTPLAGKTLDALPRRAKQAVDDAPELMTHPQPPRRYEIDLPGSWAPCAQAVAAPRVTSARVEQPERGHPQQAKSRKDPGPL